MDTERLRKSRLEHCQLKIDWLEAQIEPVQFTKSPAMLARLAGWRKRLAVLQAEKYQLIEEANPCPQG